MVIDCTQLLDFMYKYLSMRRLSSFSSTEMWFFFLFYFFSCCKGAFAGREIHPCLHPPSRASLCLSQSANSGCELHWTCPTNHRPTPTSSSHPTAHSHNMSQCQERLPSKGMLSQRSGSGWRRSGADYTLGGHRLFLLLLTAWVGVGMTRRNSSDTHIRRKVSDIHGRLCLSLFLCRVPSTAITQGAAEIPLNLKNVVASYFRARRFGRRVECKGERNSGWSELSSQEKCHVKERMQSLRQEKKNINVSSSWRKWWSCSNNLITLYKPEDAADFDS